VTVPVVRFTVRGETPPYAAAFGDPDSAYTVVYDGDCRVCGRLARMLAGWDRKNCLELIPSQQHGVRARFPWIPDRAYAESLQLIRGADGRTWQGAAAIEQLLTELPRGRRISWIFRVPLVRAIADRIYRWFARNRYHLGCGEHCQLRPADLSFDPELRDGSA
jgi:predicted DCC family thiol-disulfide oxidoreductase YuxK